MKQHRSILVWRNWAPLYDFPATFSALERSSIGGTCSQLLWHARSFSEMGFRVQALGVSGADTVEEDVEFIGAPDREEQERLLRSGRIREPFLVVMEGSFSGAPVFRRAFPKARIVHVGQNIDRCGHRAALALEPFIDMYALVSPGQLAHYSVKWPGLRHKFFMVRNIVPWERLYMTVQRRDRTNDVIWIGAWTKKGLRDWAETMERILREKKECRWSLFGPVYGKGHGAFPAYLFQGLGLPMERIEIANLTMAETFSRLTGVRVVLASLGNETGAISTLDAHAAGCVVVSGNDIIYKYANPEGTGIRVTSADERYDAVLRLLEDAPLCERLGANGRTFVQREFTEENLREDLERLVWAAESGVRTFISPGLAGEARSEIQAKIKRKVLQLRSRGTAAD